MAAPANPAPIAWAIESTIHFGIIGGSFDTLAAAELAVAGMASVSPTIPVAATIVGLTADGSRVAAR